MSMRLPALFQAGVGPGRAGLCPLLAPGAQLWDGAELSALQSDCCPLARIYVLGRLLAGVFRGRYDTNK